MNSLRLTKMGCETCDGQNFRANNHRNLCKIEVEQIFEEICESMTFVIEGVAELMKFLYQDHDIIVISDSNTFQAKQFLKNYNLDQFVDKVFS